MNKLLMKILFNGIVVVPMLMWFAGATFATSSLAAIGLSVLAFLIGDQMILRASNNLVATLADAGLAFAYLWMVAFVFNWDLNFGEIITIVAALGVVEWFFHRYLARKDTESPTNS